MAGITRREALAASGSAALIAPANEIYRVARDTTIARYNQPSTSGIEATVRW